MSWTEGHDSLRGHMLRQLWLPAVTGAQLGVLSNQALLLKAGQPVTLHASQLRMIGNHPSKAGVDLDTSTWWLLGADDTLTPSGPP